jgi:hypothetical protein
VRAQHQHDVTHAAAVESPNFGAATLQVADAYTHPTPLAVTNNIKTKQISFAIPFAVANNIKTIGITLAITELIKTLSLADAIAITVTLSLTIAVPLVVAAVEITDASTYSVAFPQAL